MSISTVPILKENISTDENGAVLESYSFAALVHEDKTQAAKLLKENGLSIDLEKITIGPNGKVRLTDEEVKQRLERAILNPDFVALNICGLCKAG